jgi:hypothetical protein
LLQIDVLSKRKRKEREDEGRDDMSSVFGLRQAQEPKEFRRGEVICIGICSLLLG